MAQWREIAGYEGLYLVSDEGQVVSLPRAIQTKNGSGEITIHRKRRKLKAHPRGRGECVYEYVALSKDGKTVRLSVHRLVAEAFLPNPNHLPEVNHKDENTRNNSAWNLEWCTRQYNAAYSKCKPVTEYRESGEVIRYSGVSEASKATGIGRTSISNALRGWSKTAGGSRWTYID